MLFAIDRFAIRKVVGICDCDDEGFDGDADVDLTACHGRWNGSWLGIFGFPLSTEFAIGKRYLTYYLRIVA